MVDVPDKAARMRLKAAYKAAEREARAVLMPLSRAQLEALVEYVDVRIVVDGCDHTTRFARQWTLDRGLDWEAVAEGLAEFGGYCDCEVVINCDPEGLPS